MTPAPRRVPVCPRAAAGLRRLALVVLAAWAATQPAMPAEPAGQIPDAAVNEPVAPRIAPRALDRHRVALGRDLFHDTRLSRDGTLACASCHRLDEGGDDGLPRSVGIDGQRLLFNTPTVFDAGNNFRLNWRGEFRTLEGQNESVLLDPRVMGADWGQLLSRLRSDPGYRAAFDRIYGGAPDRESVLDALATFQRSLVTESRFDRYLRGERDAITATEAEGYRLFKEYGCVACHQGANLGGNLFQKFGVFLSPFARREAVTGGDLGRFLITGAEEDRRVFRVPSLRNVAVTAPYLHDGRAASLDRAVEIMSRNQLGRELPAADVELIVQFLGTLTGTVPQRETAAGRR